MKRAIVLLTLCLVLISSCSLSTFNSSAVDKTLQTGQVKGVISEVESEDTIPTIDSFPSEVSVPIIEPNKPLLTISYVQKTNDGYEIVTKPLNSNTQYASIPVSRATHFHSQSVSDEMGNVYLAYGAKQNFVTKLSPDGSQETVELPFNWRFKSVWSGGRLLVLPESKSDAMYIVDTGLNVETVSPALNVYSDGSYGSGSLGVAEGPESIVVWVSEYPLSSPEGEFARYKTYNMDTGEQTEAKLSISPSPEGIDSSEGSPNRGLTFVYGVDIKSKNVLLCFTAPPVDNFVYTYFELYSSTQNKPLISKQRCCLNTVHEMYGGLYIETTYPDGFSSESIVNWRNFEPAVDLTPYQESFYVLFSDGYHIYVANDSELVIVPYNIEAEIRYQFPPDLPTNLIPDVSFVVSFPIGD
ncbi:MAG: hypothetical protein WA116_04700 [Anaerolineaceae bacterium]